MPYLKAPKNEPAGACIFCDKWQDHTDKDRENLVLVRGERAFMLLNLFPYANGHLLVAPTEHVKDLETLDGQTLLEMMRLVSRGIRALKKTANPQGFNLGANLGSVAGAGVADHVHMHVVPRWGGDNNFMPVLADTRVIPELLPQTYDELMAALKAEGDGVPR